MKTRFLISMALVGCIVFNSCGNNNDKKEGKEEKTEKKEAKVDPAQEKLQKEVKEAVAKDGISLESGDSTLEAKKDGKPYTGELWSLDGKSFKMDFKDGKPCGSTTYHKNGKVAIQADNSVGKDGQPSEKYFNDKGEDMDQEDFFAKYSDYIEEIGSEMESVYARMGI